MTQRSKRLPSMKKQFFVRSLLGNCLLMLLPLMLIGSFAIIKTKNEVEAAIKKSNRDMLYQIDTHMSSLLSVTDNITLYFSQNPSVLTQLRSGFTRNNLSLDNIKNISSMNVYLQNIAFTNEYINSVYVYLNNTNGRFLSSNSGLMNTDWYYDTDWLNSYENSTEDSWFEVRYTQPYSYAKSTPVFTSYKKLYSSINPASPIGVVVCQYNIDTIISYLSSLGLYENQSISFLDENYNIVLQNMPADITDAITFFRNTGQESQDLFTIETNHHEYAATLLSSGLNQELYYLSLVPSRNLYATSNALILSFLLLGVASIFIGILLALTKTNRDYKRLELILDMLTDPEKYDTVPAGTGSHESDPYAYITYNILNMFLRQNYLNLQISEKRYKMQLLEMQALQQQINPHFLNNTLHTIYWEAIRITESPNTCSNIVSNLSDLMRYALSNPQEEVTIKEELEYLNHYLEIQKVRYRDKFDIQQDIDEEAIIYPIPKMILQPLVENSIYHGIKEKKGPGRTKIKVYNRKSYIYISVIDNGAGISRERLQKVRTDLQKQTETSEHIGMRNTNRRLILAYGPAAFIHIGSREGWGTALYFRIPIISPEETEE